MQIKPEEKVEIKLWDWLNKFEGIEIYFNRKNKLNAPTFTTKGIKGKPDFIISFLNKFSGKEYIAIEIKDGNKSRNIFDSFKILNKYYINYVEDKTKYFIENKVIKLNHFVVASQFSKLGKLFFDDTKIIDNIDKGENDVWRNMSAKNKTLPRCEYEKTRNFLRQFWALFRPFRNENKDIIKPSLGILVSDIIMNFHPEELKIQSGMIGKPVIEIMQWKDWLKKPQWAQNIIKIGEEKKKYG